MLGKRGLSQHKLSLTSAHLAEHRTNIFHSLRQNVHSNRSFRIHYLHIMHHSSPQALDESALLESAWYKVSHLHGSVG
jgi:hypothetical protein